MSSHVWVLIRWKPGHVHAADALMGWDAEWGLQHDRAGGGGSGGSGVVLNDIEQQEESVNEFGRIPESNVSAPGTWPSSEPRAREPRSIGGTVNAVNLLQSLGTPVSQATKSWNVSQPSRGRRDDAGAGGALIGLLDPDLADGDDDGGGTNAFQSALLDTLNEARQTTVTAQLPAPAAKECAIDAHVTAATPPPRRADPAGMAQHRCRPPHVG